MPFREVISLQLTFALVTSGYVLARGVLTRLSGATFRLVGAHMVPATGPIALPLYMKRRNQFDPSHSYIRQALSTIKIQIHILSDHDGSTPEMPFFCMSPTMMHV